STVPPRTGCSRPATGRTFLVRFPTWVGSRMWTLGGRLAGPGRVTVQGVEEPRVPLTRRLTFAHLVAIDVTVAVLLTLILVGSARAPRRMPLHLGVPVAVGILLACVAATGVGLRRWRPLTALALTLAAEAMLVFLGFAVDPMIAAAIVLYMVALVKPARIAVGALIGVGVTLGVLALITPVGVSGSAAGITRLEANFGKAAGTAIVLLAAWAAGRAVRGGRAYAEGLREQGERRAEAEGDQGRRGAAADRPGTARRGGAQHERGGRAGGRRRVGDRQQPAGGGQGTRRDRD